MRFDLKSRHLQDKLFCKKYLRKNIQAEVLLQQFSLSLKCNQY
jgi:hypothetical protein